MRIASDNLVEKELKFFPCVGLGLFCAKEGVSPLLMDLRAEHALTAVPLCLSKLRRNRGRGVLF